MSVGFKQEQKKIIICNEILEKLHVIKPKQGTV